MRASGKNIDNNTEIWRVRMDDMSLFFHFRARSIACYLLMAKILGSLEPLPIELHEYDPMTTTPADMVESVEIARKAMADLPVNEHLKAALRTASLDWLNGMVLAVIDYHDLADEPVTPWMLEGAVLATARCRQALDFAQDLIEGNLEILEILGDEDSED